MLLEWARGKGDCRSVVCPPVFVCQPHQCERPHCLPWLTALPLLTQGSRARGPGEVWGLHCHSRPPPGRLVARALDGPGGSRYLDDSSIVGRTAAWSPHTCSSSSFLPPTPTLPPRTPVSNPGWPSLLDGLRGAVGLLGKSSMQEACVLRLASVAQGVCASRRRPLWCPPFPVPTSCPPCAGGSTPGFPCSQQPLGTAVHPRVPLLSCGERGVEIYFLKFALNLRGSQDRWGLPRRELCHVCCPAVPRV